MKPTACCLDERLEKFTEWLDHVALIKRSPDLKIIKTSPINGKVDEELKIVFFRSDPVHIKSNDGQDQNEELAMKRWTSPSNSISLHKASDKMSVDPCKKEFMMLNSKKSTRFSMKSKLFSFQVEIPYEAIINAELHSNEDLVKKMKSHLELFDANFFSRDQVNLDYFQSSTQINPIQANDVLSQEKTMILESDSDVTLNQCENTFKFNPHFILNLWYTIVHIYDPESKWKPYFDILPKQGNTPLFWSDQQLKLIRGTNLYQATLQLKHSLGDLHLILSQVDPKITLEKVRYAYWIFSSRAFGICTNSTEPIFNYPTSHYNLRDSCKSSLHLTKPKGNQDILSSSESKIFQASLVPFADIFNHSPTAHVQCSNDSLIQEFVLKIDVNSSSLFDGMEIFNNYGPKTNEMLILSYGFLLDEIEIETDQNSSTKPSSSKISPNNALNTYWVKLAIHRRDSNFSRKHSLLLDGQIELLHYIPSNGNIPDEMISAMRICMMDDQELYLFDAACLNEASALDIRNLAGDLISDSRHRSINSLIQNPLTYRNQILIYSSLIKLFSQRLKSMVDSHRTASQDRDWLYMNKCQLNQTEQIAMRYRIQQKDIIEHAIKNLENMLVDYHQSIFLQTPHFNLYNDTISSYFLTPLDFPQEWIDRWQSWRDNALNSNPSKMPPVSPQLMESTIHLEVPFLNIDMEWVICNSTISTTKFGKLLQAAGVWDMLVQQDDMLMALFILYQRYTVGEKWHTYFQALSQKEANHPLYCNAMALKISQQGGIFDEMDQDPWILELLETPLGREIVECAELVQYFYYHDFKEIQQIHSNFCDPNLFSLQRLYWAYSLILAESMEIEESHFSTQNFEQVTNVGNHEEIYEHTNRDRPELNQIIFIPLFCSNMHYHPYASNRITLNRESSNITVSCTMANNKLASNDVQSHPNRNIAYSNFGMNTEEMLYRRGVFVRPERYFSTVIPIEIPISEDNDIDQRWQLLEHWNLDSSHYLSLNQPPTKILALMRILFLDKQELDQYSLNITTASPLSSCPFQIVSDSNEAKATEYVIQIIQGMLDTLATEQSIGSMPWLDQPDASVVCPKQEHHNTCSPNYPFYMFKRRVVIEYKEKLCYVLKYHLDWLYRHQLTFNAQK